MKKLLAFVLIFMLIFSGCGAEKIGTDYDFSKVMEETMANIIENAPDPGHSSIAGEWSVMVAKRCGAEVPEGWYETYYKNLCATLEENSGILTNTKHSNYSRAALTVTAIGKDPTNVEGYNLFEHHSDFEFVSKQGLPGSIFSLISLDSAGYEIPGVDRIRLGSLEPRIISEEFAERLSKIRKLCPHFHLSLQSGCDETLKRMNRKYTTEEFLEKVELLRKSFVHPAITTDVICGFPGEDEAEFEQTKAFLEKVRFFEMHIFKYSKRKNTPAAVMPGQLTEAEKGIRSDELLEMERRHSNEFRSFYLGKDVPVLMEEKKRINGEEYFVGHTPEYVKVAVRGEEDWQNRIVNVRCEKLLGKDYVLGTKV